MVAWLRGITSPQLQGSLSVRFAIKDPQGKSAKYHNAPLGGSGRGFTRMMRTREVEEAIRIDELELDDVRTTVAAGGLDPQAIELSVRVVLLGELRASSSRTNLVRLFGDAAGVQMGEQEVAPASALYHLHAPRHESFPKHRRANSEPAYTNDMNTHGRVHEQLGQPRLGSVKDEVAGDLMRSRGVPVRDGVRHEFAPRFVVHVTFKTEASEMFGARDPFFWWPEGDQAAAAAGDLMGEVGERHAEAIADFVRRNDPWFPKLSTDGLSPINFDFKKPPGPAMIALVGPGVPETKLLPGQKYEGALYFWRGGSGLAEPVVRRATLKRGMSQAGMRLRELATADGQPAEYLLTIDPMRHDGQEIDRGRYQELIDQKADVSPRPFPTLLVEDNPYEYRLKQRIDVPSRQKDAPPPPDRDRHKEAGEGEPDTPYESLDKGELWGRYDAAANRLILNLDHPKIALASQIPAGSKANDLLNKVYQRAYHACHRQHARLRAEVRGKESSDETNRDVSDLSFDVLINGVLDADFCSADAEDLFRRAEAV